MMRTTSKLSCFYITVPASVRFHTIVQHLLLLRLSAVGLLVATHLVTAGPTEVQPQFVQVLIIVTELHKSFINLSQKSLNRRDFLHIEFLSIVQGNAHLHVLACIYLNQTSKFTIIIYQVHKAEVLNCNSNCWNSKLS